MTQHQISVTVALEDTSVVYINQKPVNASCRQKKKVPTLTVLGLVLLL